VAIALLLPRLSDMEATVLAGFGSFFLVFGTVEYYFGIYALWLLLFVRHQRDPIAQAIVALPFLCTAGIYWFWDRTTFLAFCNNYLMSVSILLFVSATLIYLDKVSESGSRHTSIALRACVAALWLGPLIVTMIRWPA
jgi:hypothetical protein